MPHTAGTVRQSYPVFGSVKAVTDPFDFDEVEPKAEQSSSKVANWIKAIWASILYASELAALRADLSPYAPGRCAGS
jgi:hypothetical protein